MTIDARKAGKSAKTFGSNNLAFVVLATAHASKLAAVQKAKS